jgi:hypothetical protein
VHTSVSWYGAPFSSPLNGKFGRCFMDTCPLFILPTPVYCLPFQSTDHKESNELSKEPSFADAETMR